MEGGRFPQGGWVGLVGNKGTTFLLKRLDTRGYEEKRSKHERNDARIHELEGRRDDVTSCSTGEDRKSKKRGIQVKAACGHLGQASWRAYSIYATAHTICSHCLRSVAGYLIHSRELASLVPRALSGSMTDPRAHALLQDGCVTGSFCLATTP